MRMKRFLASGGRPGVRRISLVGVALTVVVIGLASCSTTSQQTTAPAASVTLAPSALAQSCRNAEPGAQATTTSAAPAPVADDLAPLSDEFDQAGTLAQWEDLATVEKFPSKAARLDINTTSPGQLYIEPYTSTWRESRSRRRGRSYLVIDDSQFVAFCGQTCDCT